MRRSYVLAKLAANALPMLVLLVGLPSLLAYSMLSLRMGAPFPVAPFLSAVGIMTVHTLFYLTLTLMLGTIFNNRGPILGITLGVPLMLAALSWLLGALMVVVAPEQVQTALPGLGATGMAEVAAESLARRFAAPWSALLVGFLIALGWLYLRPFPGDPRRGVGVFVVMMVLLGAFLVIIPEFFYLRDSFGSRMNTVFKLWYAAWLMWAVAAAYALAWPWESFGRAGRPLLVVAILPVILGLVYTTTGLWERTSHFRVPGGPQLDGTAHLDTETPGDAVAIRWMRATLAPAVVAEAIGGSYSQYARVSAHTGFPTVLGWDFHEFQWRGDWEPQGTRQDDISRLYQTLDWAEAKAILDQYDIRYVYVGPLERSTYAGISTGKFDAFMTKLYDQDDVSIYVRRDQAGT